MTPARHDRAESSGLKRASLPAFVKPQLATLVDSVPPGNDWVHEIKFDGYRMLCRIDGGQPALLTREAQNWTYRFKRIAEAASKLTAAQVLLDGEVVAFADDGRSDFQLLQNSMQNGTAENVVYYVFDLLYVGGQDWRRSPLLARKRRLQELLESGKAAALVRYSEHWTGQGNALLTKACDMGLEGIISKRADQPYRSGRSHDWLKIKCLRSQEFVIGGFTEPAGSRAGLGALLLGIYDDHQRLRYAGRVGTGFTGKTLTELRARLERLAQCAPAFIDPPMGRHARGVHWVKPELVGEVEFTGWTLDGMLRHPSFKGLREDKPPQQIRREAPRPTENVVAQKRNPQSPRIIKKKSGERR